MSSPALPHADRIRNSILVDANGCWLWQKAIGRNGYGKIGLGGGKTDGAHRVSFRAFVGPIPDGLDICHSCDVRHCVNPAHLFAGTRSENLKDASAKGRLSKPNKAKGALHPSAKLSEDDVISIRERLSEGDTAATLGREFNVSAALIGHIKHGRSWRHIIAPTFPSNPIPTQGGGSGQ